MPRSESPKRRPTAGLLAWFPFVLALPACGAGAAKDLALVRAELDQVHKEHSALAKRVTELEGRETEARAFGPAAGAPAAGAPVGDGPQIVAGPTATTSEVRPLKVVKLEPQTAAVVPDTATEDDEPRPFLKIGPTGSVEQNLPDEPGGKPGKKSLVSKSPVFEPGAAKEYEAAYAFVKAKKPKQALDALGAFIVRYPDHPYAANALYWRGECYWQTGDYTSAATQLESLVARYPGYARLADGLLKLGLSHRKLGSTGKARAAFEKLKKEFPTSEAAKKIPPEDAS